MKDLEQIISALSKEEIRFYKLFINRTNSSKNKQRKDVELFDFIRKGKNKDIQCHSNGNSSKTDCGDEVPLPK